MNSTLTMSSPPGSYFAPAVYGQKAEWLTAAASIMFALMFFVGDLKGTLQSAAIPVDLTVAVFALGLALSALAFLARKGKMPTQVLWMFALFLAFSTSIFWTELTTYSTDKVTRLFTLSLVSAVLPAFTIIRLKDLKRFVNTIIVVGTLNSLAALMQVFTGGSVHGRLSGINADTISLGRNSGIALVGLYTLVTCGPKRRLLLATVCLPLLMVLVSSGSRGPALFAVIVVAFVTVRWSRMNLVVVALAAILFVVGGYLLIQDPPILPKASVDRILDFISQRYDSSAQERVLAGNAALNEIATTPLGLGIGGFAKIYNFGSVTDRVYPHNIVLEIVVEEGWVVGLFFVLIVLMALTQGYRCANVEPSMRAFFAIFIYALCNSLVSGDMNDNRIVYAMMCIAILAPGILAANQPVYPEMPSPSPLRLNRYQRAS